MLQVACLWTNCHLSFQQFMNSLNAENVPNLRSKIFDSQWSDLSSVSVVYDSCVSVSKHNMELASFKNMLHTLYIKCHELHMNIKQVAPCIFCMGLPHSCLMLWQIFEVTGKIRFRTKHDSWIKRNAINPFLLLEKSGLMEVNQEPCFWWDVGVALSGRRGKKHWIDCIIYWINLHDETALQWKSQVICGLIWISV